MKQMTMENLPLYISIVFGLTTLLTAWLFFQATHFSKIVFGVSAAWLTIQGLVAYAGFYTITDTIPPRFLLLVLPPLVFIILLFVTKKGQRWLDSLDTKRLTILHTVRVPVEIVLLWLFLQRAVPEIMTFEGRNFDILSGITAPIIYYFGFVRKSMKKQWIIAWNFLCLALLANIVTTAILSAPFPFQRLAMNQPNVAILYFPFIWLPAFIVPVVLFSHLVTIRQLLISQRAPRIIARSLAA
jgi:hypothetical protein